MKNKLSTALAILLTGLFLAAGTFAQETGTTTDEKTAGTVRIGLAGVKTGAIGEGVNAAQLAGAIQNALPQYLKGTKVEIVPLEARLPTALDAEAVEKECNYVLYATISHKKGGGGFGMFKKIAPVLGNVIPMAGMAGIAGSVAGTVASTAINSAATANVRAKDELTLDISLKNGETVALTKQFKAKAKSAGEDVISLLVEQAAAAIVDAVGK